MAAGTAVHAVFIPRIITLEGRSLRRCYALEVAGSLAGLGLLGFCGAFSPRLILLAYLLCFLGIALLVGTRGVRFGLLVVVAVGYAAGAPRLLPPLVFGLTAGRRGRAHALQPHKIEVSPTGGWFAHAAARRPAPVRGGGPGRLQLSPGGVPRAAGGRAHVCVLGCGSMSTVGRIGERAPSILIVDLDEEVFRPSAHLAAVQLSYTFRLEAYLTSRTVSFFTTLGCWLAGVLLGLWPRRSPLFLPLLGEGTLAYYLACARAAARGPDRGARRGPGAARAPRAGRLRGGGLVVSPFATGPFPGPAI